MYIWVILNQVVHLLAPAGPLLLAQDRLLLMADLPVSAAI